MEMPKQTVHKLSNTNLNTRKEIVSEQKSIHHNLSSEERYFNRPSLKNSFTDEHPNPMKGSKSIFFYPMIKTFSILLIYEKVK